MVHILEIQCGSYKISIFFLSFPDKWIRLKWDCIETFLSISSRNLVATLRLIWYRLRGMFSIGFLPLEAAVEINARVCEVVEHPGWRAHRKLRPCCYRALAAAAREQETAPPLQQCASGSWDARWRQTPCHHAKFICLTMRPSFSCAPIKHCSFKNKFYIAAPERGGFAARQTRRVIRRICRDTISGM